MSKSIIQTEKVCYMTGRTSDLDRHHMVPGVAYRKKSEADGLWIWLWHPVHMQVHEHPEMERALKVLAQRTYEKTHSRAEWMARYHKNYLGD